MKKLMSGAIYLVLIGMVNYALAQSTGDFRSKQSGAWEVATTWETYNGSSWVNAVGSPSASNGRVMILPGHVIASNTNVVVDQVIVSSGGTLNISGGTFNVSDGAGADLDCGGTITILAGILNGSGSIRFSSGSTFNWTGGIIGGSGNIIINSGGVFTMNGSNHYLSDTKSIINSGIWTWSAGAFSFLNSSSVISNAGIFNISTNESIVGNNSNAASFVNKAGGIITKIGSPPPSETYFYNFGSFVNNGTVNINSGRLRFYVNTINSGIISVALGAQVNFTGGLTTFGAKAQLKGLGNLTMDGAIVTSNTALISTNTINIITGTVSTNSSLNMSSGSTLNLAGGTFNGTGIINFNSGSVFNWTGGIVAGSGKISVNPGAIFTLSGGIHYLSDSNTISNSGTCTWTGGQIYYQNSSSLFANAGILNIDTDEDVTGFNSATATFINLPGGVINKIGSPSDETSFSRMGSFTNAGTININSSRIRFYANSVDSGTINLSLGSEINFTTELASFNKGALIKGEGSLNFDGAISTIKAGSISVKTINLSAGSLTLLPSITIEKSSTLNLYGGILNGTGSLKFVPGSTLNWFGGYIGGTGSVTINAGADFTMSNNPHYLTDSKTISNSGNWTWTGGTFYYSGSASKVGNNGTFNIFTDDDVTSSGSPGGSFTNGSLGIINKIGSPSNETSFNGLSLFKNLGNMNVKSGAIRFYSNTLDSGNINVALGANLHYTTGVSIFRTTSKIKGAGSLNFNGSADTIETASVSVKTINLSSGTLTLNSTLTRNSGGSFNVYGGILNGAGSLQIDSSGIFNWTNGIVGGEGSITVTKNGWFNMKEGVHYLSDSKKINNSGTWTWAGGQFHYYYSSSVVNNEGTLNITGDGDIEATNSFTATFINNPHGIINKTGSVFDQTYINSIGTFTNEGSVNINSGNLTLYVPGMHNGNYKIAAGAELRGLITLPFTGKFFTNDGIVALTGLSFTGSGSQALNGSGKINAMSVSNANGIVLGGTQTITTSLNMANGKITLGNNNIVLAPSAALSGASDSSYIVTNGTGSLQRRVFNDSIPVLFPVGSGDSYTPVTCQLSKASISDDFKVRRTPNVYSNYDLAGKPKGGVVNTNVVNSTWYVLEGVGGGSNGTLSFQWSATGEATGFKRTASRLGSYSTNGWTAGAAKPASGSGPFTLTSSNIKAFSQFAVINQLLSCVNAYASICPGNNVIVPYKAVGTFSAGNTFSAQLSDSGGSFAAPVNIGSLSSSVSGNISAIIPNATVAASGYRIRVTSTNPSLSGTDNAFDITIGACEALKPGNESRKVAGPAIPVTGEISNTNVKQFSIFPNPSRGAFTVSLHLGESTARSASLGIFNLAGERVYSDKIRIAGFDIKKKIMLPPYYPPGIYMIRVTAGAREFYGKLIYRAKF